VNQIFAHYVVLIFLRKIKVNWNKNLYFFTTAPCLHRMSHMFYPLYKSFSGYSKCSRLETNLDYMAANPKAVHLKYVLGKNHFLRWEVIQCGTIAQPSKWQDLVRTGSWYIFCRRTPSSSPVCFGLGRNLRQKWTFQQDSAPAQRTKMTQEWCKANFRILLLQRNGHTTCQT